MSSATSASEVGHPVNRSLRAGRFSLTALTTLFLLTLRQYMHGKRWIVMGILFLMPAGLAILIRATRSNIPSEALEFLIVYLLIPQALLPLVALVYSSGMLQDEQEEQTITYLLIRPMPKWAIYLVKLLATLTTTVVLTAVLTTLTYVAIYLGRDNQGQSVLLRCVQSISIHALAVISYCCFFGLISVLTKRVLIVGIIYTVVIEGVLANLPFGIRLATVIYFTRIIAYRTLDFVIPTPHGKENIAADAWQFNIKSDPSLLDHPQLCTAVTILLVSSLVFAVLAAILCSRKEFYVKTPEKN
jgi:ABC-2 type transport system permease protein